MPDDHNLEASAGWQEYRRLVLSELERIDKGVRALNEKMDVRDTLTDKEISSIWRSIDALQMKAAMVGTVSGAVVAAIVAFVAALIGRH